LAKYLEPSTKHKDQMFISKRNKHKNKLITIYNRRMTLNIIMYLNYFYLFIIIYLLNSIIYCKNKKWFNAKIKNKLNKIQLQ